jgi:hypothetical protein
MYKPPSLSRESGDFPRQNAFAFHPPRIPILETRRPPSHPSVTVITYPDVPARYLNDAVTQESAPEASRPAIGRAVDIRLCPETLRCGGATE